MAQKTATMAALATVALACAGCAAVGLTGAALGASALSAGAGVAAREGTEYTRSGVAFRTFSLRLDELRQVLSDTFARLELAIHRERVEDGERVIEARARDRDVVVRLEPLTRTMTRMKLIVREGAFRKDRATASEILTQIERTLETGAASPRHADRR